MNYGIRYVIVAAGSLEDPAEEEDVKIIQRILSEASPFQGTILSERVSDKLTLALLQEQGAL